MKLLKRDRARLASIVTKLKRGLDYVMDPQTALMRETTMGSTDVFTSVYYVDKQYASICKDIGSEFVLALSALHELERLLAEDTK